MSRFLRLFIFILSVHFSLQAQDFDLEDLFEVPSVEEVQKKDSNPNVIVIDEKNQNEMIYINMDGSQGRDARPGIISGSTPENATAGSSGGSLTLIVKRLPKKVIISAQGGDGGNGANGVDGRKGYPGREGRKGRLFRSAKPGQDGGNGSDGGDGSHGGSGGFGGKVRIVYVPNKDEGYDWKWQNVFEVDVSGGRGGHEGRPGLGGPGGPGGRGGKKLWSSKRKENGRDGVAGKSGRPGVAGLNGQEGQVEYIEAESLDSWIIEDYERSFFKENS